MIFLKRISLFFFLFFNFSSAGKVFRSPYVMFEIEDSWLCKSFGVNWVCHHYLGPNSPPAFIFTTARMAVKSEKLEFNKFETEEASLLLSPSRKVSINKHVWIDSFHQNSFYNNVLSRYERTICCENLPEKFQVLVGFHAFKEGYPKYASSFLKSVRSLSLLTSNLEEIRRLLKRQTRRQKKEMNNYIQNLLFNENQELKPIEKESFNFAYGLLFALACGLLGAFYYYKKGKKGERSSKEKRREKRADYPLVFL